MKKRILIVDDDIQFRSVLVYLLNKEGYVVSGVESAESALQSFKKSVPDLILLDVMLPGMDGIELCKELRKMRKAADTVIIMISEKGEEEDVARGLYACADDYLPKPFSNNILLARLHANLRKSTRGSESTSSIRMHNIEIERERREVIVDGKKIDLTKIEYEIFLLLAENFGSAVSRDQIIEELYGNQNYSITPKTINYHIFNLKKKMGSAAEYIESIKGFGYKLKTDKDEENNS